MPHGQVRPEFGIILIRSLSGFSVFRPATYFSAVTGNVRRLNLSLSEGPLKCLKMSEKGVDRTVGAALIVVDMQEDFCGPVSL